MNLIRIPAGTIQLGKTLRLTTSDRLAIAHSQALQAVDLALEGRVAEAVTLLAEAPKETA